MSTGRRADAVRNRQLTLDAAIALLSAPGTAITVEAIAKRAGLGAGTVVRAFGGKDALVDAAVAELLAPLVARGRELLDTHAPAVALRVFLGELIAFQAAHHTISGQLGGLQVPATTALEADLARTVEEMISRAQAAGTVRGDLSPGVLATVIGETAHGVARAAPDGGTVTDAYLTVLMDGLSRQEAHPATGSADDGTSR